jgi:endonuclease YncB( thermonuclease family)
MAAQTRRGATAVASLGIAGAVGIGLALFQPPSTTERMIGPARIIDGDSLEVNDKKIRLIGIDAPELNQDCGRTTGPYPCGEEARRYVVRLIGSSPVVCESRRKDKYQRHLAQCSARGLDLNRQIILDGWAVAYGRTYEAEEAEARGRFVGLWSGAFERPTDWRKARRGDMVDDLEEMPE